MPDARARRGVWGALAVLLALCAIAYFPILRGEFVNFDDIRFIRDNPDFNPPRLAPLIHYWRGPYFGGAFPLTYMFLGGVASLAWNGHALEPFMFRLAGLVLHAGCVAIAFDVLRLLLRSMRGAFFGAAVFALHPLQVESVTWAVTPYTLFSLGAIDLYLRSALRAKDASPETSRRRWTLYALATLFFVLAMLSKPVAMVCIPIAAALDWGWLRRRWDQVALTLAPWGALALPVVIMTRTLIGTPPVAGAPLALRPAIAMDAIAFYLMKLAWPVGLVPDYGRSPEWLQTKGPIATSWLLPLFVALALLAVVGRGNRGRVAALMAAFALSFLPVLGLLPFHFQIYSTVADRYAYLGLLAVAIAIGWWAAARGWSLYVIVPFLLFSLIATNVQARYWHDTQALFAHNLNVVPRSFAAHRILGYEARQAGDERAAIAHYSAALEVYPGDAVSHYNMGNALLDLGDADGALRHFQNAVAAEPLDPRYRNNLGIAYVRLGLSEEAAEQWQTVLRDHPGYPDAVRNLAKLQATSRPASQPAA
jgi:hypothetical protein